MEFINLRIWLSGFEFSLFQFFKHRLILNRFLETFGYFVVFHIRMDLIGDSPSWITVFNHQLFIYVPKDTIFGTVQTDTEGKDDIKRDAEDSDKSH